MDAYEQLRRHALSGDTGGWRLGLAVLHHRGVATWMRVHHDAAAPLPARPAPSLDRPVAIGCAEELVGVLASMALHAAGRG